MRKNFILKPEELILIYEQTFNFGEVTITVSVRYGTTDTPQVHINDELYPSLGKRFIETNTDHEIYLEMVKIANERN